MSLQRLQVTDFRCLQNVAVDLDSRFTLISGANGSGKTSLLEAIYVLSRGRSFRTRAVEHLIRRGADQFVVFGEAIRGNRLIPVGIEGRSDRLRSGIRAKIDGVQARSVAELSETLPVQIIDPEVHQLIEGGPARRRRYLDWGVFHVEPGFIRHWQRYHRALLQRNAALKARQSFTATTAWDSELLTHGAEISAARAHYTDTLLATAKTLTGALLGQDLMLTYRSGWSRDLSFEEALRQSWQADQERGSTQVGPQRGELAIRVDGIAARDHVSRGQQKLLAAALLIAQINLFPVDGPVRPSLLLDDPSAELDDQRLAKLIAELSATNTQLVVTTLHQGFEAFGTPGQQIRLDNGRVDSN